MQRQHVIQDPSFPLVLTSRTMCLINGLIYFTGDQHTSALKSPVDQWSLQDNSPVDQYTSPVGGLWTDRTSGLEDDR